MSSPFGDLFSRLSGEFGTGQPGQPRKNAPAPPPPDLPQGDSLVNVLASMGQTQEMFQRSAQEGATPGIEITSTMNAEGTRHNVEIDDSDLRTILGTIKKYSQVVDAYQQEADRLQQQQDRLQKNPILNVLATVGGATAMQDKRLPPIVRALGESSRLLNPTYQELEDRKLKVLGQEGQALTHIGTLEEAQERTKAGIAYRNQLLDQKTASLDEKKQKDLQHAIEWVEKNAYSKDSVESAKKVYGLDDKTGKMLETMVGEKVKNIEQARADKRNAMEYKRQTEIKLQEMRDVTADKRTAAVQSGVGDRAQARREETAYFKVEKDTNAALRTVAGTEHMREILSNPENTKYIGFIIGNLKTDLIPDAAERQRVADVKAEFFTLMNDVRNSFDAGTRFWNPSEFSNLSPKLAQATKTTATNIGILDALERDTIRNGKKMVQSSPDVDWETRGPIVFGSLWDKIKPEGRAGGLQGKAGGNKKEPESKIKPKVYNPDTDKFE